MQLGSKQRKPYLYEGVDRGCTPTTNISLPVQKAEERASWCRKEICISLPLSWSISGLTLFVSQMIIVYPIYAKQPSNFRWKSLISIKVKPTCFVTRETHQTMVNQRDHNKPSVNCQKLIFPRYQSSHYIWSSEPKTTQKAVQTHQRCGLRCDEQGGKEDPYPRDDPRFPVQPWRADHHSGAALRGGRHNPLFSGGTTEATQKKKKHSTLFFCCLRGSASGSRVDSNILCVRTTWVVCAPNQSRVWIGCELEVGNGEWGFLMSNESLSVGDRWSVGLLIWSGRCSG
ncbi:hypothetical protein CEXT_200461 [Caerostris extrusa]|uniref:Uncharacterized protein n=1 Tax=Caerostris extrusa TaxID=172846 RepID=A0AAV4TX46_CAEEX|nr:hypothetical protein CEXT_200461 [Caerostris extrusa]